MIENVDVLHHSSIRIEKEKVIYVDPFEINKNYNDADIIMITHSHYDHYSEEDIEKVRKDTTKIVVPNELLADVLGLEFSQENIIAVEPNNNYEIDGIKIETVPAYNTNKQFHPRENQWVGYIIRLNGIRYYIAGDTDITEENKKVQCDVALVPVGGTYTMTAQEAAKLVNTIKPKIAIPTHYGSIVGNKQDGKEFVELLHPEIEGVVSI